MRFSGWIVMVTGMIIFLTLIGIDTGLSFIMTQLGLTSTGSTFVNSNFYTTLIATLAVVGSGAVIVGFFAKSYDPSLVILPFIVFILGLFTKTFHTIINLVSSYGQIWMTSIVIVIFGALGVGFVMSGLNYFRGV